MSFYREIPKNKPVKIGWIVTQPEMGEMVQKYIDDPSVVSISITPRVAGGWDLILEFAVLDLAAQQIAIGKRLGELSGYRMGLQV